MSAEIGFFIRNQKSRRQTGTDRECRYGKMSPISRRTKRQIHRTRLCRRQPEHQITHLLRGGQRNPSANITVAYRARTPSPGVCFSISLPAKLPAKAVKESEKVVAEFA